MNTIFGLPSHPLFVHAPIVLMPMLFLLALVLAVRPSWRLQAGWTLVAGAAITVATTLAAKLSGESLEEQFAQDMGRHETLGNWTLIMTFVLLIASAALWFNDRRRWEGEGGSTSTLMLVVLLVAAAATTLMVLTGHAGAACSWGGASCDLVPIPQ